jgi:mannose-1-phosphate guanylyltransferase
MCASRRSGRGGEIVTFGVTPDHPATAYGYIHPAEPLAVEPQVRQVERFVEKRGAGPLVHRSRLSVELRQFHLPR